MLKSLFKRKEEKIIIPYSVKTDVNGFRFLTNFHKLVQADNTKYILDFSETTWFEANLCAVLGATIYNSKKRGNDFEIRGLEDKGIIKRTFINNGFLKLVSDIEVPIKEHSGIPFARYDMKDESEFEEYIYDNILSRKEIPKMSEGAKNKIYRSIFELFQNSVMHSGASELFVCGQYYIRKGRLTLSMVEFGHTFKHNITTHKEEYKNYAGKECIEWAVIKGNTTKNEDEAGGLGLEVIRDFLRKNEGKLQINSAEGYWEEKKSNIFAENCDYIFPGSIVNIEFNLRDKNTYITREEINISDIL